MKLAEREGSGCDKIFKELLSQSRPAPELIETHDRVHLTLRRRIIKPEGIDIIAKADQTYQLTQRDVLTARELTNALELPSVEALEPWLKRLLDWQLVQSVGRTQATRYLVDPSLLRRLQFTGETTLKRVEPHRLTALVLEELRRYPESAISDPHQRVRGESIPSKSSALEELIEHADGSTGRWCEQPIGQLCSIVDRWVMEAGRYISNRPKNQGFLSTHDEESREIERGPLAVTTHFLRFKR